MSANPYVSSGMLEAPWLVPVPIPTDTWWQKQMARFATRFFCLGKDWYYFAADGELCVIPGAYRADGTLKDHYKITDGKSYPRPARVLFNSLGIGLTEGLAHDMAYHHRCQILSTGIVRRLPMTRKECDQEMRKIGIQVNDMPADSWFAYGVLRAFGIFAWNKHRANDGTPANDVNLLLTEFIPKTNISEMPVKKPTETTR